MKQHYFVVVLAHSLHGRLRRIHVPHQALYVVLALALFGSVSLFGSIRPYRREWLSRDVLAGVTLAALAIPEVMGYTKIAGTPVITGLYTILFPVLAFALLGSSRHLVVGGFRTPRARPLRDHRRDRGGPRLRHARRFPRGLPCRPRDGAGRPGGRLTQSRCGYNRSASTTGRRSSAGRALHS